MKKILLVLFCFCLTSGALADQLYTWVDDEGTRHYSFKPPADYAYEEIGSANQITLDPETLAAMERARAQAEAEQAQPEVAAAEDKPEEEDVAQECAKIHDQLAVYEQRLTERAPADDDDNEQAREMYAAEVSALNEVRERLQSHCG